MPVAGLAIDFKRVARRQTHIADKISRRVVLLVFCISRCSSFEGIASAAFLTIWPLPYAPAAGPAVKAARA
jgi:hypothetical protein